MKRLWLAVLLMGTTMPAAADDLTNGRPEFEANWNSLNARISPDWFEDAKFGIFIHWGVYSVPAYCHTSTYSEWYQHWLKTNSHDGLVRKFHEKNYGKNFKYRDFAQMFKAELWQPDDWAKLFKRAGAKYVVLVSKHHDGFALWPSEQASNTRGYKWNSLESGPRRDICGDLTDAVRNQGLKMGFYYSFMEWENPLYETDKARYVEDHMIPQIKDLVKRYQPAIIWPDGEWDQPDTLWRSPEILAWMYNNVENYDEFVVNDRWGKALRGQTGDYYTTEYGNVGGGSPGLKDPNKPFEECRGIGHSFALNRLENYDLYLPREKLVRMFIDLVSKGGNLLLNLGPTADGRIPVIQQDRLIALGEWLETNGEAIYGTQKSLFKSLPWGTSTTKGNMLYLHVYNWPTDHTLEVPGLVTHVSKAYLLHDQDRTPLNLEGNGTSNMTIDLLGYHPYRHSTVVALQCDGPPKVINP
jgi:alpha-L-fucosidase